MSQKTNLNINPYYDDFDSEKNFLKVLFKPGYPVQSRELTTLQSILQNQVEEFGNSRAPEMSAVNIHDILDRAKRSAQLGFGAHIRFEEDYDPSLPAAFADADQLLQVILNLIKNASEACKGSGKIKLKTTEMLSKL